jgi:hypothetical protein
VFDLPVLLVFTVAVSYIIFSVFLVVTTFFLLFMNYDCTFKFRCPCLVTRGKKKTHHPCFFFKKNVFLHTYGNDIFLVMNILTSYAKWRLQPYKKT